MSDPLSLRGVFDIDRIEAVLRSLSQRLDQHQAQLSAPSSPCACEPLLTNLRASLDRSLLDLDRRFSQLESRLHRYDAVLGRYDDLQAMLDRLNAEKADRIALDLLHRDFSSEIARIEARFSSFEEQKESITRLDDSQRQLAKQLAALQELLSCKVDRVEVPLIQDAGERVKAADQFRIGAGPRLDQHDLVLARLEAQLEAKEEKSAVVERMQAIYGEFQNRPDRGEIEPALSELKDQYGQLMATVGEMKPDAIAEALDESRAKIDALVSETKSMQTQLDRCHSMMASRASFNLVEKKADKAYCEQLVHELAFNLDDKLRSHTALVNGVQKQIMELKRVQSEIDGKLGVSLKFLDWFSTVQLEKQLGSRIS